MIGLVLLGSEFEIDELADGFGGDGGNGARVYEDGGSASDAEGDAFGLGIVNRFFGFGRGHAGLESVRVEAGSSGEVEELVPDVCCGDQILVGEDGVGDLPVGGGRLLEGATCSDGSALGPG